MYSTLLIFTTTKRVFQQYQSRYQHFKYSINWIIMQHEYQTQNTQGKCFYQFRFVFDQFEAAWDRHNDACVLLTSFISRGAMFFNSNTGVEYNEDFDIIEFVLTVNQIKVIQIKCIRCRVNTFSDSLAPVTFFHEIVVEYWLFRLGKKHYTFEFSFTSVKFLAFNCILANIIAIVGLILKKKGSRQILCRRH